MTQAFSKAYRLLGRPTKYKPEFADTVLKAAAEGFSLSAAAAELGLSREQLTEWGTVYPLFGEALNRARVARSQFWERKLLNASEARSVTGGQAQILLFMARAHSQVEFNNQSGADTKALLGDLLDAVVQLRAERATKAAEPKVIDGVVDGKAEAGEPKLLTSNSTKADTPSV